MAERILVLMGPTASGKSALAERLAEAHDGELISADSALVYRGFSIGAAKPDYPHHLIHIREPADPYTAADFATDAKTCIDDILSRGRRPILVGGSMLYFRALIQGFDDIPCIDPAIRAAIECEGRESGWPALHKQLAEVDPDIARKLHPNHSQRICRALEVYRGTGQPLSAWQKGDSDSCVDQFECVALCPESRVLLHQRIAARLDEMLENGLVGEVRTLWERGDCHAELPAIRAVGYRQVWSLLEGEIDAATCRERILAATRQLAKRQLTWLRSWPDLTWMITGPEGQLVQSRKSPAAVIDPAENMQAEGWEACWCQRIERLFGTFS